jgi:cell division protein FtsB
MRGIKNRGENKWKKLSIFFALLLVFGVLTNSVRKVYNKRVESQKTLVRMQADAKILEDRQKFLENSLQKLTTKDGIAFEMRRKLNVAEAGESVAIIVEEKQPTSTPVAAISGWQKFKNFWANLFK